MRQRILRKLSRTMKLRKFQFVKHYANGRKVTENIATYRADFDAQNYAKVLVDTFCGEILYIDIYDRTESINNPIISYSI